MLTSTSIESLITTIALIFAYFVSVPIVEYSQAFIADMFGDPTPRRAGMLTLNPIAHVSVFWLMLLVFFGFGWGKGVPINPYAIVGPYRLLKLIVVYSIETLTALFLAIAALCILVVLLGPIAPSFLFTPAPLKVLGALYPQQSSSVIVFALLLMALVFFNMFFATLSFIINVFRYALALWFNGHEYIEYAYYFTALLSMLGVLIFGHVVQYYLLKIIIQGAYIIAYLLQLV